MLRVAHLDVKCGTGSKARVTKSRLRGHTGYLWNIPAHRAAWRAVAAKEGFADQLYHRWCHHLDTDGIYQLNSVLGILPESALCITVLSADASRPAPVCHRYMCCETGMRVAVWRDNLSGGTCQELVSKL